MDDFSQEQTPRIEQQQKCFYWVLPVKKKNVPEHIELLIALTNAFLDVFLMYISIIQKNVYFESLDLKFSFCNSKWDL